MSKTLSALVWVLIAVLGAAAFAWLALSRGETISAAWLLTAAVCTYLIGYRFYSRMIATKIFALNDARQTPAVRMEDGRDYVPTNRWIVFGHHFAAIAGPGPLGGAVQDGIILMSSVRHDGKSLGQMAKEQIGPVAGFTALVAVLGIMIVLIAVLALVVVNALYGSPWGTVTVGLTIPIALIMGVYLRWLRPGRVLEATAMGLVLIILALFVGRSIADNPSLAPMFSLSRKALAFWVMGYGVAASILPVWLLLAPRDYLSAFVKLGVVGMLAIGIIIVLPPLQMPAITKFIDGTGPVFAGKLFPFAFITIACGAISGFHALVSAVRRPSSS